MIDAVDAVRRALAWATANPEFAATLVATLVGGADAARSYRRTGRLPLADLPWRAIRRGMHALRRRWFSTPAPPRDARGEVDLSLKELRRRVGRQSYEPGWPLSYHYKGEDLNARRYWYDPSRSRPHRQLHIRAWEHDDGSVSVDAHEEPSAVQHPRAHIRSRDMTDATEWVAERAGNGNGLDPRGFG